MLFSEMPWQLRGLLPSRGVPTLLTGVRRSDTRFSGNFLPRRRIGQRVFAILERVFHCHAVFVGIHTRRLERVMPCHWGLIGRNTACACLWMPPIANVSGWGSSRRGSVAVGVGGRANLVIALGLHGRLSPHLQAARRLGANSLLDPG